MLCEDAGVRFVTTDVLFICGGAFVGLEDIVAKRLGRGEIGPLPVIATLDCLGVDDLVRVLQTPKNSLIEQFRKLVRFQTADLVFNVAAVKEFARIALQRGTGARGLRSVVEEVIVGILFDVEAGVRYVITDKTVKGEEAVKQSMKQRRAPLERLYNFRFGGTHFYQPLTECHRHPAREVRFAHKGVHFWSNSNLELSCCRSSGH